MASSRLGVDPVTGRLTLDGEVLNPGDPRMYGRAGRLIVGGNRSGLDSHIEGDPRYTVGQTTTDSESGNSVTRHTLTPEAQARLNGRVQLSQVGFGGTAGNQGYGEFTNLDDLEWDDEFGIVTKPSNINANDPEVQRRNDQVGQAIMMVMGAIPAAHAAAVGSNVGGSDLSGIPDDIGYDFQGINNNPPLTPNQPYGPPAPGPSGPGSIGDILTGPGREVIEVAAPRLPPEPNSLGAILGGVVAPGVVPMETITVRPTEPLEVEVPDDIPYTPPILDTSPLLEDPPNVNPGTSLDPMPEIKDPSLLPPWLRDIIGKLPAIAGALDTPDMGGAAKGLSGVGGKAVDGIQIPGRKVELIEAVKARQAAPVKSLGDYLRGG